MVVGIWLYMSTGLFGFVLKKQLGGFWRSLILLPLLSCPALNCEAVTKGGGPQLTSFS